MTVKKWLVWNIGKHFYHKQAWWEKYAPISKWNYWKIKQPKSKMTFSKDYKNKTYVDLGGGKK